MTRAFSAHPGHPIIDYLVRLHSDLGGRILDNQAEAKALQTDMKHVEAVLKMFDPDYDVRAISPRRRFTSNPWFRRGTLFRHALDVLRSAMGPMTVRAIAEALIASKGITDATTKQRSDLQAAIRSSLVTNAERTVQRVGEGMPARWIISGAARESLTVPAQAD